MDVVQLFVHLLNLPDFFLQLVQQGGLLDAIPNYQPQVVVIPGLFDVLIKAHIVDGFDRVRGAAHFEVPIERGQEIIAELRRRLPGYAVPRYVQEQPGAEHKLVLA